MLRDKAEGVVTELIDRFHVEVDWGDDFSVEVHIDEVVPIDGTEASIFRTEDKDADPKQVKPNKSLGGTLFDLSLAVVKNENGGYGFVLLNPEPATILYTCYVKSKHKYTGMAFGSIKPSDFNDLFVVPNVEIDQIKSLYFQLLSYKEGQGHPHAMQTYELTWEKGRMMEKSKLIEALRASGWIFSLREKKNQEMDAEQGLPGLIKDHKRIVRSEKEVDLHAEVLVPNPTKFTPGELLQIQMEAAARALWDAVAQNAQTLIVIHGIGEGTLKREVIKLMEKSDHVKSVGEADFKRYGKGATRIDFY